ncbi:PREDICTED: methyl-CpG-binding domain-containing protein 1-like [Camelina sativa]|uniref:Methyl-CpG-binding domain-containing protein 1-like n=1 Tax=Camelina sativa TaxID=90675 RepID=A0ABM1QI33_CAMSA|nr:PREDICTED: methyl-CpG-binding domain-containing protein 1-like [Camelina sativa]XP_019086421.1 PREDICTED: methyl-CpG-binding domain-containing protein 1-like [Camelina sativa]
MDASSSANPTTLKRKGKTSEREMGIFAVQCEECHKWRQIDTQEAYEQIRRRLLEDQFVCMQKEGTTCEDAGDLVYDSSRVWSVDKRGLPETPRGFRRSLVMRKDYSKVDAYYVTPTGKKLKMYSEIEDFLKATDPDYDSRMLEVFSFTVPKIMEKTVPKRTKE